MEEPMKSIILSLIAAPAARKPIVKKALFVATLALVVGFLAVPVLMPSAAKAEDARVTKSMATLKDQTTKLGAPKIEGKDAVGGKDAPALYSARPK
jgi:cyanate permease